MKLKPFEQHTVIYEGDEETTFDCCDSIIAVLDEPTLKEWTAQFLLTAGQEDAPEFCAYGTRTLAFQISGDIVVMVSDSGGELATGEFLMFCEEKAIPYQSIVDSPDCTDVAVEDIYTGECDNNQNLLGKLHKIYN